jgi:hypothetical protein
MLTSYFDIFLRTEHVPDVHGRLQVIQGCELGNQSTIVGTLEVQHVDARL